MARIEISLADQVMSRYGQQLKQLGEKKTKTIMVRALNHESRKAFTRVKRDTKAQASFSQADMQANTRFIPASGGSLETRIWGRGKPMNLAHFKARQIRTGVSAMVWGKRKQFAHLFVSRGNVFYRVGRKRLPIKGGFGPNLAKEMVKDKGPEGYYASLPAILARVSKEIAAVLRGY